MNNKENQLGINIRSLRKAFGETGEQLGEVLNVEKNTISSYETGRTKPDQDIIRKIAKHYMISTEELIYSDLSVIGRFNIDKEAFFKNIDTIIPIVSSEKALENPHFQKAYCAHKEFYDELKRVSLDKIDNIDICLDEYSETLEDNEIEAEVAANLIGIMYLIMMGINASAIFASNPPAVVKQIAKKDEKTRKLMENPNPSLELDAKVLLAEFHDEESTERLSELLTAIKKSPKWSDLGDYYLALQYVWNLVDNDLDWGFNQRIGVEMLYTFASVKNDYAARYLQYNIETLKGESSQFVDDTE